MESRRISVVVVAVVSCALGTGPLAVAQEPPLLKAVRSFTFTGSALEHDNLSAVLVTGDRLVLVDDEERHVLVGRHTGGDTYDFGPPVALTVPATPGAKPAEFDLEGLVQTSAGIIAVGSHAAVRTSADDRSRPHAKNRERQHKVGARADRDVILRFVLDAGAPAATIEPTVASLRGIIDADPILKAFGAVPSKENGIDIEGLAADGDVLVVGFRGPVLRHGFVPVLRVSGFPAPRADGLSFVRLGGRGIRDIVKTSDGFLVLAGAVGDSDQDGRLFWWDGRDCVPGDDVPACRVSALGRLSDMGGAHAEGMALLGEGETGYEILVVFDGVPGGAPSVFQVPRPSI